MFKKNFRPKSNKLMSRLGVENSTYNYRNELNKSNKKSDIHGMLKHKDTRYLKWLKDQLDEKETRDKLLTYRNDIIQGNERANYRNQLDIANRNIQRDNLNHNSIEHLQHQINQFRNLQFT